MFKSEPPSDTHKLDRLLSRLGSGLSRSEQGGPGARLSASRVWGRALSCASITTPGSHRRRQVDGVLFALQTSGYATSDAGASVGWAAAEVGRGQVSGALIDATRLLGFVRALLGALGVSPEVGAVLRSGAGMVGALAGPFGVPFDRALADAPQAVAGHLLLEAPDADALAGLGLQPQTAGAGLVLPALARQGGWQRLGAWGRALRAQLIGDPGLFSGFELVSDTRGDGPLDDLTQRARLLGVPEPMPLEREHLEFTYRSRQPVWIYLITQSDNAFAVPESNAPTHAPGADLSYPIYVWFDDQPALERPLLLVTGAEIADVQAIVAKANLLGSLLLDARIGALKGALAEAGVGTFAIVETGRFARGVDPALAWRRALEAAQAAYDAERYASAAATLSELLEEPVAPELRAVALISLGDSLRRLGRHHEALGLLAEGEALAAGREDVPLRLRAWRHIGRAHMELEAFSEAALYLDRAVEMAAQVGDLGEEAEAWLQKGVTARRQHRFATARRAFERALPAAEASGRHRALCAALGGLGQVEHDLGRLDAASQRFMQALAVARQVNHVQAQIRLESDLALVARDKGLHLEALHHIEEELRLMGQQQVSAGQQAQTWLRLGLAHEGLEAWDEAAQAWARALNQLGPRHGAHGAGLKMCLGRLALRLGDTPTAAAHLDALDPRDPRLPPDLRWQLAEARASLRAALGDSPRAEFEAGVEAVEAARDSLPHLLRTDFLELSQRLYDGWIQCLQAEGADAITLLDAVERSRARALLDALVVAERGGDHIDELDLDALAAALEDTAPVPAVELQRALPRDLTALVYHCLPDQLLVFRMSHAHIEVRGVAVARCELAALAARARVWAAGPGKWAADPVNGAPWVAMSAHLLGPIHDWLLELPPDAPVGVVLQGPLYGVPIHALPWSADGGSAAPLLLNRSIFSLPSVQALGRWLGREPLASSGLLTLCNPGGDLPWADHEATLISKRLGGEPLRGGDATPEMLAERGPSSRFIHLAVHGRRTEARAWLELAGDPAQAQGSAYPGGAVDAAWISRLGLSQTELVVLSACETAVGELSAAGEGQDLLSWAFLKAGARAVVASGWRVDDRATAELMGGFWAGIAEGKSKLAALNHAQRAALATASAQEPGESRGVRRSGAGRMMPSSHPYYVAAFTLTGDWR